MTQSNDVQTDEVFKVAIQKTEDFKFDATVAQVFDDMVNRSVPFYCEIQRMIAEQAADYAQLNSCVYDLGCATGTTLIGMNALVEKSIRFIGLDDSQKMLDRCQKKLESANFKRPFTLRMSNLNDELHIDNASVVVLCLTLQFVRPIYRERVLKNIFDGLNSGGVLILVEKILAEDSGNNRRFIQYYYNHKRRNHYSEMEISQKREALENILIPYKLSENITLLRDTGFSHCEVFFKWYNFSGLIAVKA